MQILRLELENTKSYEKAVIDFTTGTNAIVGHNGAGKSTVLEAIGFALFDFINYRQADFVREGQKTANITVTFASGLDDRAYQVVRRCGSSNQHYIYDPDLDLRICEGKADVLSFLREHMGVEPTADLGALFNDAVGVPQGTLAAAFLQQPSVRKKTFDALLQVEEYEEAARKLLEPLRALRDQVQALDVKMADLAARLERLPHLEEQIQLRTSEMSTIRDRQERLEQRLSQMSAEREKAEEIEQQIQQFAAQLQEWSQQRASITERLDTANKAVEESQAAKELVEQNQPGHDAYLAAQAKRATLLEQQQKRQVLQSQVSTAERERATKSTELRTIQQALLSIQNAISLIHSLQPEVEQQVELEEQLAATQKDLVRYGELQKRHKHIDASCRSFEERVSQLKRGHAQRATLLTEQTGLKESLREKREEIQNQQRRLAELEANAKTIKEQNRLLKEVETASCPVCEQPLTLEHRSSMLERNIADLTSHREVYRQTRDLIQQSSIELTNFEQHSQTVEEKLRRLPRQEELDAVQQELSVAMKTLAECEDELKRLANAEKAVIELQESIRRLGNPKQKLAVAQESIKRQDQLDREAEELQSDINEYERALSTLQNELEDFATVDQELTTVAITLREHEPAYQKVLTNRQIADRVEITQKSVEQLRLALQQASDMQEQIKADHAELAAKFDREAYTKLLAMEQTLRDEQIGLKTELSLRNQDQEREQAEVAKLRTFERQRMEAEQKRAQLTQQEEALETVRQVLRQSGPFITQAMIQQVSSGASQIYSEIMQDFSRRLSWNADYGISLEVDGRERQFAQLSGGEQMSAALSVRLALLREMSNIDVAFFDEPTSNLDIARRESLAQQILDVKGFKQMFVISHDDTFEQVTQNLIRIQKNGQTSLIVAE